MNALFVDGGDRVEVDALKNFSRSFIVLNGARQAVKPVIRRMGMAIATRTGCQL